MPLCNTRPDPATLLTTQISLLQTFSSFLTVALHTILYTRSLYPADTFLLTRAYNFPVRQNRHPLVCKWVLDTVSEVEKLMKKGVVARVVVVLFSQHGQVMERFLFDVSRFPEVGEKQLYVPFEKRDDGAQQAGNGEEREDEWTEEEKLLRPHNLIDIEEQLRATIRHLSYSAEKLSPLPENCTYTVAVELKDEEDAQPPIEHLGIWEPTEPSLQTGDKGDSETIGRDLGGAKSVAVRNVESGEFVLESWIEEGDDKVRWVKEEEERLRREDERAYDDD